MNWCFWIDYRHATVPKLGAFRAVIDSSAAREISLELVSARVPGRFESLLYRALGLVLEPSVPIATLSCLLTPTTAHVTFGSGEDDDHRVIASPGVLADGSSVSFALPTGEEQIVPAHLCIPRTQAPPLFEAFLASGQQPRSVTWVPQSGPEA